MRFMVLLTIRMQESANGHGNSFAADGPVSCPCPWKQDLSVWIANRKRRNPPAGVGE
jgi:hypothetical protein